MGNAIRWTPEALAEYQRRTQRLTRGKGAAAPDPVAPAAPKKESKYRSRKVERDGVTYDSNKEATRALVLERMQAAGEISDLRRQVAFVLAPAVRLAGEMRQKPALRYWADFTYLQNGVLVVEDVKSAPTRTKESYRIKKHLLATVHGIHIKEV